MDQGKKNVYYIVKPAEAKTSIHLNPIVSKFRGPLKLELNVIKHKYTWDWRVHFEITRFSIQQNLNITKSQRPRKELCYIEILKFITVVLLEGPEKLSL